MKHLVALLPVLIAFQAGAPPALAWTWPVDGPVLRPFALGDDPYAAGQHRGIDVAAAPGTSVHAPAAGIVRFTGTVPGGGRTVTLHTGDGYAVTLLHLGEVAVARSASVAEGATVGIIGPSGDAEHPQGYVHLGVRVVEDQNGYLDPLAFLPARDVAPPPASGPPDEPEPREDPSPPPAPVETPAPAPAEPALGPPGAPATSERPVLVPAASANGQGEPSPASRQTTVAPDVRGLAQGETPPGPAPRIAGETGAAGGAATSLASRTVRRFEAAVAPESAQPPGLVRNVTVIRGEVGDAATLPLGIVALLGALGLGAALVILRCRLRRGQLGDARPAYAAAAVLGDAAGTPAEHARRPRTAEDDRLVLHRDLEWIPLRESEALADLDRNDDPAELVEVPDDPRRRPPATVVAHCRAHRVRRHQSSRRRPERLVAR